MKPPSTPIIVHSRDWQDLIGIQFALRGQNGPAGLNCYGLVREVYRQLQIELPERQESALDAQLATEAAGLDWTPVAEPQPYAVALYHSDQGAGLYHLGIVTPELTLLHAQPKKGVVVSELQRYRPQLVGYYRYTPGAGERLPVADGNVGRTIGMLLVTVAAIAATWYVGGVGGYGIVGLNMGGAWGAAAGMAVSMVGSLVVNAIAPIKPDTPQLSGWGGDLADSRSYTWDGIVNDSRQGLVKAIVFGRVKVGGQLIAEKTWFDAANNEYLDMLLCPAVGRITRFSGIQLNDTDIELYKNTAAVFRPGDDEQRPIDKFNRIYLQYTAAAKLQYDASATDPAAAVQFTTKTAVSGIRVTVSAPNGIYEMPASTPIPHDVDFRVQYREHGSLAWLDLPTVNFTATASCPFISRSAGAFTGEANPFTLTDSGAYFTEDLAVDDEFILEADGDTYYCQQFGSLTDGAISFNAFTDAGYTVPALAPPADGPYLLRGAAVAALTGEIPIEYADAAGDGNGGGGGDGGDGGGES